MAAQNRSCYRCGQEDHRASMCPYIQGVSAGFAGGSWPKHREMGKCCYKCGDIEHETNSCPNVDSVGEDEAGKSKPAKGLVNSAIFLTKSEERNFALIVEGTSIWVSREVLSMYSTVFKKMFYGDFIESTKDSAELPDKTQEEMLELLNCLFYSPQRKDVDADNVFTILRLADEYDIDYLKQRCRDVLSSEVQNLKQGDEKVFEYLVFFSRYFCCNDLLRQCIPLAATLPIETINVHRSELQLPVIAAIFEAKSHRLHVQSRKHRLIKLSVIALCAYCHQNECWFACKTCKRRICSDCAEHNCINFHKKHCVNKKFDYFDCLCGYVFDSSYLNFK